MSETGSPELLAESGGFFMTLTEDQRQPGIYSFVLITCAIVSLAAVAYPIYVIRPFRAQGARELTAALLILRLRPVVTLVLAVAAIGAGTRYWRLQRRTLRRVLAVLGAVFVCVLAALSRVNIYEWMFHPAGHLVFSAAQQAKLDPDEKVVAVKIGNTARAYPIRSMSYHHIVNDLIDKAAIVATY